MRNSGLAVLLSLALLPPAGAQESRPFAGSDLDSLLRVINGGDLALRKTAHEELMLRGADAVPGLIETLTGHAPCLAAEILVRIGEPAVQPLIRSLDRHEWEGLQAAVETLGRFEALPRAAIPPLVRVMREFAEDGRRTLGRRGGPGSAAATTLAKLGGAAVPAALELLRTPDRPLQFLALDTLWYLGRDAADAVPALKEALRDPEEDFRVKAIRVLGHIGPRALPAVPDLLERIGFPRSGEPAASIQALQSIGRPAVAALISELDGGTPARRELVASALGSMACEPDLSVPALARVLEEIDGDLRSEAAIALTRFQVDGVAALAHAIERGPGAARRAAVAALAAMASVPEAAVPALTAAHADSDPEVRRLCWDALVSTGSAAVPFLAGVLGTQGAQARTAAATLRQLGHRAVPALPALIAALGTADSALRLEVLWTLGRLGPDGAGAVPRLLELRAEAAAKLEARIEVTLFRVRGHEQARIDSLIDALQDPEADVRAGAAEALGKIRPDEPRILPPLIAGLKDLDPAFRREAVTALGKVWRGDPEVLVLIFERVDDAEKAVAMRVRDFIDRERESVLPVAIALLTAAEARRRETACAILEALGHHARGAIAALEKAKEDPERAVRQAAASALAKIR